LVSSEFVRFSSLPFALVVVIHCGGRERTIAPTPWEQFAEAKVDAYCASIEPCCASAGFPYDPDACRRALILRTRPLVESNVSTPGVHYDPDAAGECLASTRTQACPFSAGPRASACDHVFIGQRQPGEACSSAIQCAQSSTGYVACAAAATHFVCTFFPDVSAAPRANEGESCITTCEEQTIDGTTRKSCTFTETSTGSACYRDDGLHCFEGTCKPLSTLGEPCLETWHCVSRAYCERDLKLDTGTCTRLVGSGGDCSRARSCDGSTYCDGRTCRPLKVTGESCQFHHECSATPCDLGTCARPAPVLASACAGL
jgi:hypothetical protein